jgi:RNA polymerase sigma factor (TIGR02999 family)
LIGDTNKSCVKSLTFLASDIGAIRLQSAMHASRISATMGPGFRTVLTEIGEDIPLGIANVWVPPMNDVTRVLSAIEQGDPHAADQLLPLVYDELRRLAAQKLAQEKPGQTLEATALVHEAYLRLVEVEKSQHWDSRGHFFAAAAEAMRRILIELARRKRSQRQGGAQRRCQLSDEDLVHIPLNDEIINLDEAISKLASTDPQVAELVKLRVFAGMTIEDIAALQGISPRTVKRNWAYARAWLGRELAAYDKRNG